MQTEAQQKNNAYKADLELLKRRGILPLELRKFQAYIREAQGEDSSDIDTSTESPEITQLRMRYNMDEVEAELDQQYMNDGTARLTRMLLGLEPIFDKDKFIHIMALLEGLTPDQIVRKDSSNES